MGTKLQFNVEDAGLSVDGTEVISANRAVSNLDIAAGKITSGSVAAARLPYTITTTAPTTHREHLAVTFGTSIHHKEK